MFRGAAAAEASGVDRIKPAFLLPSQRLIPDVFANHFVRGLGGAGAGHFYRILGNTDLEVILEISPGEVPAFAVGQAFEIVPYWTLSTLFQSDMNPAVHDSSGDSVFGRRTTLMLSNITSTGTNLGAGGIYYRPESDTWKVAFDHDPSSSVGDNADGVASSRMPISPSGTVRSQISRRSAFAMGVSRRRPYGCRSRRSRRFPR